MTPITAGLIVAAILMATVLSLAKVLPAEEAIRFVMVFLAGVLGHASAGVVQALVAKRALANTPPKAKKVASNTPTPRIDVYVDANGEDKPATPNGASSSPPSATSSSDAPKTPKTPRTPS